MIEEFLQEDSNVKRKREKVQRQYSLLSELARQLGHHDNQAVAPSTMSNGNPAGIINPETCLICLAYMWVKTGLS